MHYRADPMVLEDPVDQVAVRYTAPIGDPAVSADECRAVTKHLYELEGSTAEPAASDIEDCRGHNSAAQDRCILAAKSRDEVGACFAH